METSQLAAIVSVIAIGICLIGARVFRHKREIQSKIMLTATIVTVVTTPICMWVTVTSGLAWVMPWGATALLCATYYRAYIEPAR